MSTVRFVEIYCDGEGCDEPLANAATAAEARIVAREQGCSRERTPGGTYIDLCFDCTKLRQDTAAR